MGRHLIFQRQSSDTSDRSGSYAVPWASFVGAGTRLVSDLLQLLLSTGLSRVWSVDVSVPGRLWVGWVPSHLCSSGTSLRGTRTCAEFTSPPPTPPGLSHLPGLPIKSPANPPALLASNRTTAYTSCCWLPPQARQADACCDWQASTSIKPARSHSHVTGVGPYSLPRPGPATRTAGPRAGATLGRSTWDPSGSSLKFSNFMKKFFSVRDEPWVSCGSVDVDASGGSLSLHCS